MNITMGQIQSLLSSYHRQQVQSRLSEARIRGGEETAGGAKEDQVVISAEAKRLQIYQKTAEEVLRRLKEETTSTDDAGEGGPQGDGTDAAGASEP